ncbi:MAG: two-component regulator propeller domain-containing protein [Spirosomataceae bacterium]
MRRRVLNLTVFNGLSNLFLLLSTLFSAPTSAQTARFPFTFTQMKMGESVLENMVVCMLKDSDGYFWLGTYRGLKRYDDELTMTHTYKPNDDKSLVCNHVLALCEDKMGRIWIGTRDGVCYFDKLKNEFTRLKELNKPDYACLNIMCDSKGAIWFSIRDRGLFRFDSKTNTLKNFRLNANISNKVNANRVLAHGLVEDPFRKGIWIASNRGLNYLDYESQRVYNQGYNPNNIPLLSRAIFSGITIQAGQLVYADDTKGEIVWYDTQLHKPTKTF